MSEMGSGMESRLPQRRNEGGGALSESAARLPPHPLDAEWYLNADGETYGPYSGHVMKEFVRDGRLMPGSSVLRAGRDQWLRAVDDPVLGGLFAPAPHSPRPPEPGPISAGQGATVVQVTNHVAPHPIVAFEDAGPAAPKSPGIALLLSLLICGVGQMYNGQVAKGILMLIGSFLLWIILLGWAVWIWSMIDAYSTAKAMNLRYQRLLASGYRSA